MKDFLKQQFLAIYVIVFIILRTPSLYEPNWYGDEGVYQIIGRALRAGSLLYADVWDNKPPLIYVVYALFDGNQQLIRLFNLCVGIGTVIIFYFLSNKLLKTKKSLYLASGIFTLVYALPFIEGTIANAENFMLLFLTGGIFLLFQKKTYKMLSFFSVGILLALATLLKIVATIDLSAVLILLLFRKDLKSVLQVLVGFGIPWVITILFFVTNKAFTPFVEAVFTSNIEYVAYKNFFIIPHGFLIIKLFLFTAGLVFLFVNRKKLSPEYLFILLWFIFSLFNVFFSGRGYIHYLLLLLPSYSLILGLLFESKKNTAFLLSISLVTFILIRFIFPLYWNIGGYYTNFIAYRLDMISSTAYQAFFDPNVITTYQVSDYMRKNLSKNDKVFIWGNSPQLYVLSNKLPVGRFVVAYHILRNKAAQEETERILQGSMPKFIVVLPDEAEKYPFDLSLYHAKTFIGMAAVYQR